MNTNIYHFNELSLKQLYAILQARSQVFVVEQTCIYQDIDGVDEYSHHVLLEDTQGSSHLQTAALSQQQPQLMAYCRIIPKLADAPNLTDSSKLTVPSKLADSSTPCKPSSIAGQVAIGRVLVLPSFRGQGLAKQLMQTAIQYCHTTYPEHRIKISAQTYLMAFYQSLGFTERGEVYLEDGIEHIEMWL